MVLLTRRQVVSTTTTVHNLHAYPPGCQIRDPDRSFRPSSTVFCTSDFVSTLSGCDPDCPFDPVLLRSIQPTPQSLLLHNPPPRPHTTTATVMDSNRPLADLRRDRLATIRAARASIEAFQQEIRDAQRQIDRAQRDIASKEEEINAVNAEIEQVDTVLRMLKDQRATEVRSSIFLTHTKLFEMSS
jgi:hypothetical protein